MALDSQLHLKMSSVQYKKHRVFRETPDVIFYDISVEDSNASDLVVHEGPAVSPPDDVIGAKQFYIHYHQVCLLYTSPSPRDMRRSRMPSSA